MPYLASSSLLIVWKPSARTLFVVCSRWAARSATERFSTSARTFVLAFSTAACISASAHLVTEQGAEMGMPPPSSSRYKAGLSHLWLRSNDDHRLVSAGEREETATAASRDVDGSGASDVDRSAGSGGDESDGAPLNASAGAAAASSAPNKAASGGLASK